MIRDLISKIGWTNYELFNPDSAEAFNIELSGKLMALRELLQECQIGDQTEKSNHLGSDSPISTELPNLYQHRALIFCQWRASVDLIAQYLENQSLGVGIRYLRLDGTVPPDQRQYIVDRFNNDPSIDLLLVTTHIGGVGLTLTGADIVIFLDHDFNPVKDMQAVDRAHRLGQTKTVNVYRLITQGSIEEKIMRFQKFKLDTANVSLNLSRLKPILGSRRRGQPINFINGHRRADGVIQFG
jgi:TATA-binding protein-associated factor